MGEKGAKLTQTAKEVAAELVEALTPVGEIKSRAMFGGYGIFESGTMFVLINSSGDIHFRVDSSTRERYEAAGSSQHSPMPYFEVPGDVRADYSTFIEWAKEAAQVAHASRK